jgi:ABC-type sugar transport system ATPase subunit
MVGISKSFGGVEVLKKVDLTVEAGQVHALLGENGAGKSSLMKILTGVHQPDEGEYFVGDRRVRFSNPAEAQRNRVSMVYQEFGLVQTLSVAENILLGRLRTKWGRIDWPEAYRDARVILDRLGSKIAPTTIVGDLKVADQQEVEIARALSFDPLVFLMDEPTSALSRDETENLYGMVRSLQKRGVAIIYVTHKLDEVFTLADRVTILRDGSVVGSYDINELDIRIIVERMTGKPFSNAKRYVGPYVDTKDNLLQITDLTAEGLFLNINLSVPKGKIVAVAGLIGAGKSELARAIVGALPSGTTLHGNVTFDGEPIDVRTMTPNEARRRGIGFVSEDRQREGIIPDESIQFNVMLPALRRVTVGTVILARRARQLVFDLIKTVGLRPRDPDKLVRLLSGGNQQKVVISKWLAAQSKLLILDEPTRGIDVGARQEIYDLIRHQADTKGIGVLLLSSDMREVLLASDWIVVMTAGEVTAEVAPYEMTEEALFHLISSRPVSLETPLSDVQ